MLASLNVPVFYEAGQRSCRWPEHRWGIAPPFHWTLIQFYGVPMSWDLQITQSSDWIPPSATKKKKKKSFLVGCDLAKSGRNLSYREIFIIVVSVTRALRGPSPLLRFFAIHVCLHTLFSGRYLQYHPIFGHSYSSFSLWVIIPNSFLYFTMTDLHVCTVHQWRLKHFIIQ